MSEIRDGAESPAAIARRADPLGGRVKWAKFRNWDLTLDREPALEEPLD